MSMEKGLFIFHRDLRMIDNIGLITASHTCKELYVCFIFTPEQVGKNNSYRSQNAIQFMIESLEDLSKEIAKNGGHLCIYYGKQLKIIEHFINKVGITSVHFNRDYTPYAIERQNETANYCKKRNIVCETYADYYLHEPGTIKSGGSKNIYKKYTPFYEATIDLKVEQPLRTYVKNLAKNHPGIDSEMTLTKAAQLFVKANPDILVHGGRANGLKRLKESLPEQNHYDKTRDFFINKTSFLSAYLKFGCISIREVYYAYKEKYGVKHGLIRELLWRDFFAHILYAYPETMTKSYNNQHVKWSRSKSNFDRWCRGETGFPAIDAGMRQLNATGYMHNRLRMATANFLTKTLLIDWREGAKYFAQKLTDYDVASNQGNWQSVASTGVYATPYFRDMNPWIQSKQYDNNCEFIKKWIPELAEVEPRDIHNWHTAHKDPKYKSVKYYKPMVDYNDQKEKMLEMYQK